MTTTIKTARNDTRYAVEGIENGKLVVRQPSGKRRLLTVKEVGRARYDSAVAHFYAEQKREAA